MVSHYALIERPSWIVPFILIVFWWGMLIAFLIIWAIQGKPLYGAQEKHMDPNYVSYIGAQKGTQPVFITCSLIQGVFYIATLALLFRFRVHGSYLPPYSSKRARNFAIVSIVCGIISQIGILLVSIFDVIHHGHVHLILVGVFVIFAFFSVLFNSLTYKVNFRRRVMWSKFIWMVFGLAFAFVFGIEYTKDKSISATFEWMLAFWYGVILFLWQYDLLQASRLKDLHSNANDTEKHSLSTESSGDRSDTHLRDHVHEQIHRQQLLRLRLYHDYYRPQISTPKPAYKR